MVAMRFDDMPDASLLDFISSGHEKAFEALVRRHHRRFFAAAYRWVLNAEDAEDIVQHAFLKLWSGQARFKTSKKAKFTTWFYRIVYNQAIDLMRAQKQQFVPLDEQRLAAKDNPEQDAERAQRQRLLTSALGSLSESQRVAMQLFYIEGLKQKEIARIMGLTVKALESQLTRARAQLRAACSMPEEMEEHHVATQG